MSSELAPYSMAKTASAIISPALGPKPKIINIPTSNNIDDEASRLLTNNMHSQNPISLFLAQELDLSLRI